MVLRRVVPSALLNDNRVELEGGSSERLPTDHVYVSPTSGKVYDGSRGDTLAQLSPDATEVKRTTWWIRLPWRRREELPSSSSLSEDSGIQEPRHWYNLPEVTQRLRLELMEMKRYFPDFELYVDDNDVMLLKGEIDGLGDAIITYPKNYPSQKFSMLFPDESESMNRELQTEISQFPTITPAGSLIVAIRLILKRRKEKVEPLVHDSRGKAEDQTGNTTNE